MNEGIVVSKADIRRHELLEDVAEQAAQMLIAKHGLPGEVACDIGNGLADFLSEHWSGQTVYITADTPFKMSQRDMRIYRRMERGNAHDIAREEGISFVRVYQIYKRMLAIARAKAQPGLFEEAVSAPGTELSTGKLGGDKSNGASHLK
jgi:Mor family transcriptional regulator